MSFSDAVINGVPILLIVAGLVEFLKKFGVSGNALTASSLILGVLFGVLYQINTAMPIDFSGWLGALVWGLGMGLTASGLYDLIKSPQKTK